MGFCFFGFGFGFGGLGVGKEMVGESMKGLDDEFSGWPAD